MGEVLEREAEVSEKPTKYRLHPKKVPAPKKKRQPITIIKAMSPEISEMINNLGISSSDFERISDLPSVESELQIIHSCLERLYPYNPDIVKRWMVSENMDFNDESPLEFIIDHQSSGLNKVSEYVYQASLI